MTILMNVKFYPLDCFMTNKICTITDDIKKQTGTL